MSELRAEAINLIEKMPEEYLFAIVQYAQDFLKDKNYAEEQMKLAKFQSEPDKYEDEINEFVNGWIKETRNEERAKRNENFN